MSELKIHSMADGSIVIGKIIIIFAAFHLLLVDIFRGACVDCVLETMPSMGASNSASQHLDARLLKNHSFPIHHHINGLFTLFSYSIFDHLSTDDTIID